VSINCAVSAYYLKYKKKKKLLASENHFGMATGVLDHDDNNGGIVDSVRSIWVRRSAAVGRLGAALLERKGKGKKRITHGRTNKHKTSERNRRRKMIQQIKFSVIPITWVGTRNAFGRYLSYLHKTHVYCKYK